MSYAAATTIIVTSLFLSAGGILALRFVIPPNQLHKNHEIGGLIFLQVGVIYAVLVGFVVVATWDEFKKAAEESEREAAAIGDVARLAAEFSADEGARVREAAVEYLRAVVEEEWDSMSRGERSERAAQAAMHLWDACLSTRPRDGREEALYDQMLDRVTEARELRSLRLIDEDDAIPPYLWFVLVLGAAVVVLLSFFFGMESLWTHASLTTMLAGVLAMLITLALLLDRPFTGDLRVTPEAFTKTLTMIERM